MTFARCQEARRPGGLLRGAVVGSLLLAILAACSGCTSARRSAKWRDADRELARLIDQPTPLPGLPPVYGRRLPAGADLAQQAAALEAAGDPACVDLYFAATCAAWRQLEPQIDCLATPDLIDHAQSYHASLAKLIATSQCFGRLDPGCGLQVIVEGEPITVPVLHTGFSWTADDFNELEVVGPYKLPPGMQAHRTQGLGVELVAKRLRDYDEQFFRRLQPFAATAVLLSRDDGCTFALELYNPARCTNLQTACGRVKLAGDLTAPLAWLSSNLRNDPITQFLRPPPAGGGSQLVMLEPYQPGKIPVVFIHGLLSDPSTWIHFGNELTRHRWYRDHCQTWVFRYPTGAPFLVSAAALRRELNAALAGTPGAACDPAAREMVLVGHSMGGLVAKLQVADSADALWCVTADRPLESIQATAQQRQLLRETFFFSPQPFVRQVVFVGTPHCGSSLAARGIGRLASSLVQPSTIADQRHRDLVERNPGTFAPWFERRVPNSIDLLEPSHPLLQAINRLCIPPEVQLHSVIGVVPGHPLTGPGDGVVSVASATHRPIHSELLVNEGHEQLHHAARTMIEMERILQDHLAALGIETRPQATISVERLRQFLPRPAGHPRG